MQKRMYPALAVMLATTTAAIAQVQPIGPFEGDAFDGFDKYGMVFVPSLDIFQGEVTVRTTFPGPSVFVLHGSNLNGMIVLPFTGPWLMGVGAPGIWEFQTPITRIGGYFATNSGAANATIRFFDTENALIATLVATIAATGGSWTWNGWESSVPIGRITMTGNGINQGFIDFDDMRLDFFTAAPPMIVHGIAGPGQTTPCSGFIDPRRESNDGERLNQGLSEVRIRFTEQVFAIGGGPVTPASFIVTQSGPDAPPTVAAVDATANPLIRVTLSRIITLQQWTTIRANVQNAAGTAIQNMGNLGPGMIEPDRVDVAFLPADVTQSGNVNPLDLLAFKQAVNAGTLPAAGCSAVLSDYADIDRNNAINPLDLLAFKRLINNVPPATQSWSGEMMPVPQP